MSLRPPTREELAEVAAINNFYLGIATMQLEPVTTDDFVVYLPDVSERHAMIVKVFNGKVLGFALVKPYSPRAGYRHACEHSVYLHPDVTERGYGQQLMHAIMDEARKLNYNYIAAKIWADNQGRIRFHERLGFQKVGIQRAIGRVNGVSIDTMIMEALLDEL
jgi:phosphinothricin acetyltransferase